jgi:hypothetical protein
MENGETHFGSHLTSQLACLVALFVAWLVGWLLGQNNTVDTVACLSASRHTHTHILNTAPLHTPYIHVKYMHK